MVKLTAARRGRLPKTSFACPNTTPPSYPINDVKRIVNARTRTKQFGEKCRGQKVRICRAANRRGLMKPSYSGAEGWRKWCK